MENQYEPPSLTVLGEVTDYTQARIPRTKPGIFFDMQGSTQGSHQPTHQPNRPATS